MSDSVPENVKLHKDAPEGLSIVPESEWNDYDKAIWGQFDQLTDGMWKGEPPHHSKMAIGRMAGKPVLITRTEYSDGLDEMRLWESGKFSHTLVVDGNVFLYPSNLPDDNVAIFDEWIEIYSTILAGDGEYNLFKDIIPEEFTWCLHEMFQDQEPAEIRQYITDECGSVQDIKDPKVREFLEGLCGSDSDVCPFCGKNAGEECEHLLAFIDLTFNDVQMGSAVGLFHEVVEARNEENAEGEIYDMFVDACREVSDVYETGGEEDGYPGYCSATETYWSDDMKTALNQLRAKLDGGSEGGKSHDG